MANHLFPITSAVIENTKSGFQSFMTVCFWIWGGFGLLLNIVYFLSGNVGVGTSAYLAASLLMWIGGTMFFGLAALISPNGYEFKRPSDKP